MTADMRSKILETLYACLEDYAVDNRGDVGSWVRLESMDALYTYMDMIVSSDDEAFKEQIGSRQGAFYERFVCAYIQ